LELTKITPWNKNAHLGLLGGVKGGSGVAKIITRGKKPPKGSKAYMLGKVLNKEGLDKTRKREERK